MPPKVRQYAVLLHPDDLALLKRIAARDGCSAADIVRRLVRHEGRAAALSVEPTPAKPQA